MSTMTTPCLVMKMTLKYWADEDQDYYDDAVAGSQESPVFDVEEYDEIYATYMDAKGKLNAMRTARGFYPVVAMVNNPDQSSQASSYGGKKSSKGGKSSRSKGKGKQLPKGRRPPDPRGRAAAAGPVGKRLCLRCGQPGHLARSCPQQSDKKRKADDDAVNMVSPDDDNTFHMDSNDGAADFLGSDVAVQDGGAASVLGSVFQVKRYLSFLLENGFDIHSIPMYECAKGFKFGNSSKEVTKRCVLLPMFIGGKRIDALTYLIQGEAPILIGRPLLEQLGFSLNYEDKTMKWPGMEWEPVPTGPKGEYVLHLGKDIKMCLHDEPAKILIPEDADAHVGNSVSISELLKEEDVVWATVDHVPEPCRDVHKGTTRHFGGSVHDEFVGVVKRLCGHQLRKMEVRAQQHVQYLDKTLKVSALPDDKMPKTKVIWEVFVGAGRTTEYLKRFPHVKTEIFSLQTGWDFEDASHRRQFLARVRKEKPDEIMMSPMCRLWSPLQELSIASVDGYKEKLVRERKVNHDTVLTMCSVAYMEQAKNGRNATMEHPWTSRAWSTRAFSNTADVSYDVYVDQCEYGLTVPDNNGVDCPAKKPTCFRTTKKLIAEYLGRECSKDHVHYPLEGSAMTENGSVPRSKLAESYPEELARMLAVLFMADEQEELSEIFETDEIFAEDDMDEDAGDESIVPLQPSRDPFDESIVPLQPSQDVLGEELVEPSAKNRALRRELGSATMNYVSRLHKNLGHPGPEVLCKMLEEVQATENVLRGAREYICPQCYARRPPGGVPPAAGLHARYFGERLMADTAWIDTDDGRVCVMTMMDQATRYIALRIMKSEQSVDLVKGLERGWIKHFAVPRYLRIDEGKGFAAQHLRDWCSDHNIILEIAPAEAHNWIGSIERKHQVVRRTLELYMADRGIRDKKTLLEAAIYCPGQINSLSYTRGFTPSQWVLERAAADTQSLTASIFNPCLQPMNDPVEFSDVQAKRLSAQQAFLKADSDARLRRAMLQNYKENKEQVVVGQLCYYWRIQGTGILQQNKWRGPARCVAEEKDEEGKQTVLWLCHGTSLLRCSPHQVRPRVEEAGSVAPIDVKAALADLQALRARSTTQFRDVSEPNTGIEDLVDPDEFQEFGPLPPELSDYEPTEPAPRNEQRDNLQEVMHELANDTASPVPGAPLLYQRSREGDPGPAVESQELEIAGDDAERAQPDAMSLGPGVEPEPLPDEESKRLASKEAESQPAGKRARKAEDIPVPDPAPDELIVEDAYIAEISNTNLPEGWVLINGEFELDEVYMNVAFARKGEALERDMTVEERENMIEAKVKELKSYFDNQVWEFNDMGNDKLDRVITARWVLTWKPPLPGNTQRRAKARLVLRGYQDPDVFNLEKASPTANKITKMLLLALTSIAGWTICCGDVRCAFLSGAKFDRCIIVRLPADCSALLGCSGVTHMKMNKSAYGLSDAPLLWWREADRRLRSINLRRHRLDKCCYMYYNKLQKLVSVLVLHVDDVLIGVKMDDPEASQMIEALRKSFDFGKWQVLSEKEPIIYCGGRIELKGDVVSLDFEEYMKKVMPVTVHRGRGHDEFLNPSEVSKARALIGALQWPAGQGCPHLCASASINAANINKARVDLLLDLNKTLRFAKSSADFRVQMRPVCADFSDLCFLCFSDAAFNVRADGSSQGGFVIVLTSKAALKGEQVPYSLVSWRSFKLPRVCRSSLSAESQACATALDELMMVKSMVSLMLSPDQDPRDELTAAECGESAMIIDAKALYDSLQKDGIGSAADKRAGIEILCIKEELVRLKTHLRWVSSERMLADGMTKVHARQSMIDMMRSGYLKLIEDANFTAAKKKGKDDRKKSVAKTFGYKSAVAERISMVVASECVVKASALEETEGETYMIDFAMVITMLAAIVGFCVIARHLVKCFQLWFERNMQNETCLREEKGIQAVNRNEAIEKVMQEQMVHSLHQQLEEKKERINELEIELTAALRRMEAYRRRSQLLMWSPCNFTPGGSKWHMYTNCAALEHSLNVESKDRLCQICMARLREDTGGHRD